MFIPNKEVDCSVLMVCILRDKLSRSHRIQRSCCVFLNYKAVKLICSYIKLKFQKVGPGLPLNKLNYSRADGFRTHSKNLDHEKKILKYPKTKPLYST